MKVYELLTNKEIEEILEKEPLGSEIIGELFKILIERGEENDTTKRYWRVEWNNFFK